MKRLLTRCLIILLVTENVFCNKPIPDLPKDTFTNTSVTYIIFKGTQYCTPNPLEVTSNGKISFTAVFDSSCIYQTVETRNQNDINKLYGFSDCNTHHLVNSARIGWRWSKDSLRLFAFVHNDSVIVSKEITTAAIDSIINCSIECLPDKYNFAVNGIIAELVRNCTGDYNRYKLYPFFGGNEFAPHDISIQITELVN